MDDNILNTLGIKVTRQRTAILNIIQQAETPLSADEIYARLPEKDSVNFSTVYRTLSTLAERGALVKVGGIGGKIFFLLKNHSHKHHLICTSCQKVIEIDQCPIETLSKQITDSTGFVITGHCLELTGFCPQCASRLMNGIDKH